MKTLSIVLCVLSVYGVVAAPVDERQCRAPNGKGLQVVLEEFEKLIPKAKLIEIYTKAVTNDPEVERVMEYLDTDEFRSVILMVQGMHEFTELMEYACDTLYIDMYYYFNQVADFFDLPKVTRPPHHMSARSVKARSGFKGMLQDMLDVIPVEQVQKLFEEKLETDEYVKKAVETMRGPKFTSIVKTLENTPQYKKIVDDMRQVGVEIDEIIAEVKKFFNW